MELDQDLSEQKSFLNSLLMRVTTLAELDLCLIRDKINFFQ